MAEEHQKFLDFDWSDERWQAYLNGLYPPPGHKQILKFKKKWYKKTIDPNFDDAYEPAASGPSCSTGADGGSKSSSAPRPFPSGMYGDGSRWAVMGAKATVCFGAYAASLTMSVGAIAGVFPAYQALVMLVGAFILEILAKYGIKFNVQYLRTVLLDDVGMMPLMAFLLLMPGMHTAIRTVALVSPSLTALLSFVQICKAHPRLPRMVRDFFAPLADISAQYQVMQIRAHSEVVLGIVLVIGVFTLRAALITVLPYWTFMMMRYMMNPWTQASFRKIDDLLNPVLGRIPGVRNLYAAVKRGLYSFVDPDSSKRRSPTCTIS